MTTPQSIQREVPQADPVVTAATREALPYAQPTTGAMPGGIDAMLIDAIRAHAGPYIPAEWRSSQDTSRETVFVQTVKRTAAPTTEAQVAEDSAIVEEIAVPVSEASGESSTELPWIDAFFDGSDSDGPSVATEPFGIESIAPSVDPASESPVNDVLEVKSDDVSSPSMLFADDSAPSPSVSEDADSWPMAEAGDAMRALAGDLVAKDSLHRASIDDAANTPENRAMGAVEDVAGSSGEPASTPEPESLPMWSDDDMMDIMPVAVTRNSGEQGHWAAQARQEDEPAGSGEAVAQVLESLARRARDGELPVHGYSSDMGDAAVLAAALASLLGVRR